MSDAHWIELLLALIAGIIGWASFRLSTRAVNAQSAAAAKAVDAKAYERAKDIYEGAIGQLREELTELRAEVERLRLANNELRTEVSKLRGFRVEAEHLEETKGLLIAEIERLGGTWPSRR